MSERLSFVAPKPYAEKEKVLCETEEGVYLSIIMPRAVGKGTEIQVTHTKRVTSKEENQLFVTMPPGVAGGERFAAILRDGTELVVTAPTGLAAGKQMLVKLPEMAAEGGETALHPLGHALAPPLARTQRSSLDAAAGAGARAKGGFSLGISYRQMEQYVIARYGVCQNGRLMGALAAAVRAGRLTRDGKLYLPTGSMNAVNREKELLKRSFEEQQAEKLRLKRARCYTSGDWPRRRPHPTTPARLLRRLGARPPPHLKAQSWPLSGRGRSHQPVHLRAPRTPEELPLFKPPGVTARRRAKRRSPARRAAARS